MSTLTSDFPNIFLHQTINLFLYRLIMIGITSQHRICAEPDPIKSISFDCVYKGNNINAIVKGKKKSFQIKEKLC